MSKIGVDYGHTLSSGSPDYGAVGIKAESNLTREVGKLVTKYFRQLGHTVIECGCDSASSLNASLSHRYNTANNNNVDYFISIHFNAFDGSAKGTEVLYYSSPDDKMKAILNKICALGYTNRGLKQRRNLAVLKNTNAKAMLIECAFCDNKEDMNRYNADKLARAIVEGFTGKSLGNNASQSVEEEEEVAIKDTFCEEWYLKNYPDVAKAVKAGQIKSGHEHYINYGKKEGRKPNIGVPKDWNEKFYLENNEDVNKAISKGQYDYCALKHYLLQGWKENRIWNKEKVKVIERVIEKQVEVEKKEDNLYRVIAGTYVEKKNAEAQVKKLKKAGFDSFVK